MRIHVHWVRVCVCPAVSSMYIHMGGACAYALVIMCASGGWNCLAQSLYT